MANSVANDDNEIVKIKSDAKEIGKMIEDQCRSDVKILEKAQEVITNRIQFFKKKPLDPEEQDYIKGVVGHTYTAAKYESNAQMVLNMGKILLIGGIASVPATFIASEIKYENKDKSLSTREKELEARLVHGKQETPIFGKDSQGDIIVTQGNTKQLLAQTRQELTVLHEQGRNITRTEMTDGLMGGLFVSQMAAMFVSRAWRKTAKKIGETFADHIAPLPQDYVQLPKLQ